MGIDYEINAAVKLCLRGARFNPQSRQSDCVRVICVCVCVSVDCVKVTCNGRSALARVKCREKPNDSYTNGNVGTTTSLLYLFLFRCLKRSFVSSSSSRSSSLGYSKQNVEPLQLSAFLRICSRSSIFHFLHSVVPINSEFFIFIAFLFARLLSRNINLERSEHFFCVIIVFEKQRGREAGSVESHQD